MDCHRSVSMDCVLLRNSCRIPKGQLVGMRASKLAQSFCVRVGMLRHGASSFTRDACRAMSRQHLQGIASLEAQLGGTAQAKPACHDHMVSRQPDAYAAHSLFGAAHFAGHTSRPHLVRVWRAGTMRA